MTVSQKIASQVRKFSFCDIPARVLKEAKYHLLDSIGVMLAATTTESGRNILNAVLELGEGKESLAIGSNKRIPAHLAAFINGSLLHSLEYDDTHTDSIIHASSVVVPSSLAVSEWVNASGRDFLASLVLGWETLIRFGLTAPNKFQSRGFHTTAVCGPFSASLITGFLLRSHEYRLVASLGIAGSQSSGIFEYVTDGASVKQMHPGWAAHNGIIASRLAKHSFRGPFTVFEGEFGFYKTFTGKSDYDYEKIWNSFGNKWMLTELSYKPYSSCHFNHAFIDCAKEIYAQNIKIEEIEKIICKVSKEVIPVVCEPWENKINPKTGYEAKFSLPYAVVSALLEGDVTLNSYNEDEIRRVDKKELYKKVTYEIDQESNFPQAFPGCLKVILKNGKCIEKRITHNRGGPKNPLSEREIEDKFRKNASQVLSSEGVDSIIDYVMKLENMENIGILVDCLETKIL